MIFEREQRGRWTREKLNKFAIHLSRSDERPISSRLIKRLLINKEMDDNFLAYFRYTRRERWQWERRPDEMFSLAYRLSTGAEQTLLEREVSEQPS